MLDRYQRMGADWWRSRGAYQVFALGIAIAGWVFVNAGGQARQSRTAKVQYVQLPEGLVFERSPVKEIQVELVGPLYRLRNIHDDDLVYVVDLGSAKAGVRRVRVDTEEFRVPPEVQVEQPSPRIFSVQLEEVYSRSLNLKAFVRGIPSDGHEVKRIRFNPESLVVVGPRSLISKLEHIPLEVNVDGRSSSFSFSSTPELGIPEAPSPEPVQVQVELGSVRSERELEAIPVLIEGGGAGVRVDPSTVRLTVEGPMRGMDNLSTETRVVVNVESLKKGRYRVRGQVKVPEGVRVVSIEPESFLVEVP